MDVDQFRIQPNTPRPLPSPPKGTDLRQREPFLKGPVPVRWLAAASAAGGSGLAAGICLWFKAGCTRLRDPIKVTRSVRESLRLSGDRMHRGLDALAKAGLIEVEKSGRGRCPVVRLLALEKPEPDARPDHG